MTYEEAIEQLNEMRSRYNSGFSSSDREIIDALHRLLFNSRVINTYCKDCWRDAYILVFNKLKRLGTMPGEAEYILVSGEVMHVFGTQIYRTGAIDTSEAEQYLKRFPKQITKFAKFPDNWQERIATIELTEIVVSDADGTHTPTNEETASQALLEANAALQKENADLRDQLLATTNKAKEYLEQLTALQSKVTTRRTRTSKTRQ